MTTTHLIRTPHRLARGQRPILIWCAREDEAGQDNVSSEPMDVTCPLCLSVMEGWLAKLQRWDETRKTAPGTVRAGG